MSMVGLLQSSPPDVALAIEADHVAAARLSWRGATATVAAHTVESLPAGAVVPSLAASNMNDVTVVARAVQAAIGRLGARVRRAALVIPDTVGKVSLLRFEKVPPRAADLMELVRWQIRKSVPFPIEQAVVSFTRGSQASEAGHEFVVSVARAEIVQQYEAACQQAGIHAGIVDLATFSVINSVLAGPHVPEGDWLLVHTTPTYATLAVLRGADVIFFRNRVEETEGSLADVVHQTAMYYEDRLKGQGFTRVLLSGGTAMPGGPDVMRRSLEDRLRVSVEGIDPRAAALLTDRISASPSLLDALAPLVGILMRERKAA